MEDSERAARGHRVKTELEAGSALALGLRFLQEKTLETFRSAKSPSEAWYARCMDRVVDDFRQILLAYVKDGESAAARVAESLRDDAEAPRQDDGVLEYLRRAGESRAAVANRGISEET